MRNFNVTGLCVPGSHYMADTSEKLSRIMQFVEKGNYFSINRGRQYGKTTTFSLLEKRMPKKYTVISISFEAVSDSMFETEAGFCQGLLNRCAKDLKFKKLPWAKDWEDGSVISFDLLDGFLTKACRGKKIVLMIDEVDKSSNNAIFLKFLGILRDKYLSRNAGKDQTFQSVILAGVYDIKNLKLKMIQAGTHQLQDGEKRINSPWNIAINFNNEKDTMFLERECRILFITYLRAIINGNGFYYLENETREGERTDVIVDYSAEQFIVELKLWRGEVAHDEAYQQLSDYLDYKNKDVGYLLTFDFRKTKNVGKPKFNWVEHTVKKSLT
jgi:hypothetical protein